MQQVSLDLVMLEKTDSIFEISSYFPDSWNFGIQMDQHLLKRVTGPVHFFVPNYLIYCFVVAAVAVTDFVAVAVAVAVGF